MDENRSRGGILSTSDLLSYAYQAANGMMFLANKNVEIYLYESGVQQIVTLFR
jgi:hypothetical protein